MGEREREIYKLKEHISQTIIVNTTKTPIIIILKHVTTVFLIISIKSIDLKFTTNWTQDIEKKYLLHDLIYLNLSLYMCECKFIYLYWRVDI